MIELRNKVYNNVVETAKKSPNDVQETTGADGLNKLSASMVNKTNPDMGFQDYTEIILKAIDQPTRLKEGVQITDLTLCHRQKIFGIVNPKRQTPQTIIRTAAGTGLHRLVQRKIKNPDPER